MMEFVKLVFDYDEFEYMYDTYGYHDAFSEREEAREAVAEMLSDEAGRKTVIYRLTEIAEEDDEYSGMAWDLIRRIEALEGRSI